MKDDRPLNAAYDDRPAAYDRLRDCWLNRRRLAFLAERLRREPPGRIRNVLELGSGTGWLLLQLAAMFPETVFWGVEPLAKYCEFARAQSTMANARFLNGTAEDVDTLDLPPIDVALSNDVLHHVSSLDRSVAAVSKVAAPGCLWHAIEPNYLNLYSFLRQSASPGERVFWPRPFSDATLRRRWRLTETSYLFLIPPFVRDAPAWLQAVERRVEWMPFAAGGVYMQLEFAGRRITSNPTGVRT